ncbi:MAG: S-adenosylmethionine:tRNA ribosyltransferase-isomerase [Bacteroides sp.]|nr:S-adenosylmethionine:tRNA ribosyltransferase-isomerase [Ruminococcus flavefaciens]MCM1555724.1 S-adenosylmethionine:tRNA ribosyltransferase-isomerase [Bacteroides sp.]
MPSVSPLRNLRIEDYSYPLPDERIALYPLAERDASKLLVYRGGEPEVSVFRNIGSFLPESALLVFNDTRVVHARLVFCKEQAGAGKGARIEIFCLEPTLPAEIATAFAASGSCRFKCLIGNNKRWKEGALRMEFPIEAADGMPTGRMGVLQARKTASFEDCFEVEFSWDPAHLSFAQVLEQAGKVPLPPYIHRQAEESDKTRYQTVFARFDGSVAAPTAGLHFTPQVLQGLKEAGIEQDFITLHVGAGTFRPVKAELIGGHAMHYEHILATEGLVRHLLDALKGGKPVVPVGTTSMRSLESLYWIGLKLLENAFPATENVTEPVFEVHQWEAYEVFAGARQRISAEAALEALLAYMEKNRVRRIHGHTALMIAPGYEFALCKGIVTNFHQPQSTLLLLVSALIGPVWRNLYNFALNNGFRFLSYGDSCLFLPPAR